MAINDATGNISHNNKNIAEIISGTSNNIQDIIGGVSFFDSVSNAAQGMFGNGGGSFVGMDSDNIIAFENAVDTYRDDIQSIIDGFNADASMEAALKGAVADAVHGFLAAIKTLLDNYVAAIDIEKKDIREANNNYLEATGAIASDISGDSDSIRSSANGISID